jgi:hypothetical protein
MMTMMMMVVMVTMICPIDADCMCSRPKSSRNYVSNVPYLQKPEYMLSEKLVLVRCPRACVHLLMPLSSGHIARAEHRPQGMLRYLAIDRFLMCCR